MDYPEVLTIVMITKIWQVKYKKYKGLHDVEKVKGIVVKNGEVVTTCSDIAEAIDFISGYEGIATKQNASPKYITGQELRKLDERKAQLFKRGTTLCKEA